MKIILGCIVCLLLFCACKKQPASVPVIPPADSVSVPFINYFIKQGQQFCDQSAFVTVEYAELKFVVKFDSSAIYATSDPGNQYDINKLYGFSDNDAAHQQYSARFGWRWSDEALRLFAYVYNNGVRSSRELGTVQPGNENDCSIKVGEGYYLFSLNNITDTIPRSAGTAKGKGYRLYPYFGGDETAPHDITISIREIKTE